MPNNPIINMGKHPVRANLAILATVFLWGMSYISIKVTVSEVPPTTMAFIRFFIASVVLLFVLRKLEPGARLHKVDIGRMFLAGGLGITLYFYFENAGVRLTTAANASLIAAVVPVTAIILDIIIFKTKATKVQVFAMVAAFIGAYLAVTANGQLDLKSNTFIGNLLMLCAMAAWVTYTLVTKSFRDKYSGLFLTAWQTFCGTILLLPLTLLEYKQWTGYSLLAWANILYLAIFCSALGYFLYIYALKRLDVAITTLYLNLVPIIGVLSGHFVLNERILPIQIAGGLMIILSIVAVNMEKLSKRL